MKAIIVTFKCNAAGQSQAHAVSEMLRSKTAYDFALTDEANVALAVQELVDNINSIPANAASPNKLVYIGAAIHPTLGRTFVALCDYRLK